jgi:hypothetical protein
MEIVLGSACYLLLSFITRKTELYWRAAKIGRVRPNRFRLKKFTQKP